MPIEEPLFVGFVSLVVGLVVGGVATFLQRKKAASEEIDLLRLRHASDLRKFRADLVLGREKVRQADERWGGLLKAKEAELSSVRSEASDREIELRRERDDLKARLIRREQDLRILQGNLNNAAPACNHENELVLLRKARDQAQDERRRFESSEREARMMIRALENAMNEMKSRVAERDTALSSQEEMMRALQDALDEREAEVEGLYRQLGEVPAAVAHEKHPGEVAAAASSAHFEQPATESIVAAEPISEGPPARPATVTNFETRPGLDVFLESKPSTLDEGEEQIETAAAEESVSGADYVRDAVAPREPPEQPFEAVAEVAAEALPSPPITEPPAPLHEAPVAVAAIAPTPEEFLPGEELPRVEPSATHVAESEAAPREIEPVDVPSPPAPLDHETPPAVLPASPAFVRPLEGAISGLGDSAIGKLGKIGVTTIGELAAASPEQVKAALPKRDHPKVARWLAEARGFVDGAAPGAEPLPASEMAPPRKKAGRRAGAAAGATEAGAEAGEPAPPKGAMRRKKKDKGASKSANQAGQPGEL